MFDQPNPIISAGEWKRSKNTPREIILRIVAGWPEWVPSHDELVNAAISARDRLTVREVAHAFVGSLADRRTEWRVVLGCYAEARFLQPHAPTHPSACMSCNALFNQRVRWTNLARDLFDGWASLTSGPALIAFVLDAAAGARPPVPGPEHWEILRRVLQCSLALEPDNSVVHLLKAIGPLIRGNASERRRVIELLCFCGIWEPPSQPSILDRRHWPEQISFFRTIRTDWRYPAVGWRAKHGVNRNAIRYWFPELLPQFG